ncbi:unnamed protein product, partial [Symbiodinium microadriaticum]
MWGQKRLLHSYLQETWIQVACHFASHLLFSTQRLKAVCALGDGCWLPLLVLWTDMILHIIGGRVLFCTVLPGALLPLRIWSSAGGYVDVIVLFSMRSLTLLEEHDIPDYPDAEGCGSVQSYLVLVRSLLSSAASATFWSSCSGHL